MLSDFAGRTAVLYFYPAADKPGCTKQACGIRDRGGEYAAAGAVVLGVSPDPFDAVKAFHAGQSLDFTLLADTDPPSARPTASGRGAARGAPPSSSTAVARSCP